MACVYSESFRIFDGEIERMKDPYNIILRPIITEKSTLLKEKNREVCFEVAPRANKIEIKRAIEQLFKIKVENVRVQNKRG